MNICDNSLLRLEAFLNSADKAAKRFNDANVSAQAEGTIAKIEWAKEGTEETWVQRCARVVPKVSQRKIDDTIAGRFGKMAQDTGELSPAEYEGRLKAGAEAEGLTYHTPEERAANFKVLMELMAEKRAAAAKIAVEARVTQSRHDAVRNDCVSHEGETKAEKKQAERDEAEAIRVANGGKPAQQRTYAAPAVVEAPTFDKERDNLILLVMAKLQPLSTADLNEVNDLIDALTYPLRKQ